MKAAASFSRRVSKHTHCIYSSRLVFREGSKITGTFSVEIDTLSTSSFAPLVHDVVYGLTVHDLDVLCKQTLIFERGK